MWARFTLINTTKSKPSVADPGWVAYVLLSGRIESEREEERGVDRTSIREKKTDRVDMDKQTTPRKKKKNGGKEKTQN